MGLLKWRNDGSHVVQWFFITALGSRTGELKPGEEHSQPNQPEIKSIGIRCTQGPVHVIDNLETELDAELIASDVIPMGDAQPL
jgi:hypothetical protein